MSAVEEGLQQLGGRELPALFEADGIVQVGLVLAGIAAFTREFQKIGVINEDEQLVIAMYGMEERRYFALPANLDKYSFVPQLRLALLRDTDKVWGTMPEV
jgi:hypothetical protein